MYTKIHLQLDKSSNQVEKKTNPWMIHIHSIPGNVHYLCKGKPLQRGSSLFRYQFAIVRVVRLGLLKGYALSKFDRKTFPSYSSSTLYVSVPGYYFSHWMKSQVSAFAETYWNHLLSSFSIDYALRKLSYSFRKFQYQFSLRNLKKKFPVCFRLLKL